MDKIWVIAEHSLDDYNYDQHRIEEEYGFFTSEEDAVAFIDKVQAPDRFRYERAMIKWEEDKAEYNRQLADAKALLEQAGMSDVKIASRPYRDTIPPNKSHFVADLRPFEVLKGNSGDTV